jgi:hypothetical protein
MPSPPFSEALDDRICVEAPAMKMPPFVFSAATSPEKTSLFAPKPTRP